MKSIEGGKIACISHQSDLVVDEGTISHRNGGSFEMSFLHMHGSDLSSIQRRLHHHGAKVQPSCHRSIARCLWPLRHHHYPYCRSRLGVVNRSHNAEGIERMPANLGTHFQHELFRFLKQISMISGCFGQVNDIWGQCKENLCSPSSVLSWIF
jgi:hypothetical protein